MHLLWIRHAQSANNAGAGDPDHIHVPDAPLTQLGVTQANHLATRIRKDIEDEDRQALLREQPVLPIYRVDRLLCSPMQRAIQTTKPIAQATGCIPEIMPDIFEFGGSYRREQDGRFTGTTGMTAEKMRCIIPNINFPDNFPTNGWWNPADGHERYGAFLERAARVAVFLKEKAAGSWASDWVVMVSHADFTNALFQLLLSGKSYDEAGAYSFIYPYNTSVSRLDFDQEGYVILRFFSRFDHLPLTMVTK